MLLKMGALLNGWLLVFIPIQRCVTKVNYVFNHLHLVVTLTLFFKKATFVRESSIVFYAVDFILMNTYKCITKFEKVQYKLHHGFAVYFLLHNYPLVNHIYFITEVSNIPLMLSHYLVSHVQSKRVVKSFMLGKIVWYFYFRCIYPIRFINHGVQTLPNHIMIMYSVFYLIGPYYSYSMVTQLINI